jgi:4-hydroxybenzoate polyprenyltransferase/phosphoserine phosphatase
MTAETKPSGPEIQSAKAWRMDIPLCVDLDGSLLRSDLLVEALFGLVYASALTALQAPFWLLRGKANLKAEVARRVNLDVTTLPYNERFLSYLREQRAEGRHLVLATASPEKYALQVAEHLGLFDEVIATENNINLSGENKAEALVQRFGEGKFDYAGNGRPDLAVWKHAHHAVLVDPEPGVARAVQGVIEVETLIENKRPGIKSYLKALRLHQWSKNALIFLPLLGAHRAGELDLLAHAFLAFIVFGLCASSVYLLNDLLDLPADRSHPNKRRRPFAAGTVPIIHGVMLVPILLILAFGLALLLPPLFVAVLALYYVSTLSYSLWLKRVVLVDVLLLAGLYTLRVLAGAAAVEIIPSFWLLSFSMFLFLSLALAKRHTELMVLHKHGSGTTRGRGYQSSDLEALLSLGSASGYMAVLVLALYINSPEVGKLYNRPEAIWLLCPLLLYWISRMWLGTHRGKLHDDPLVFALKDHVSRWVILISLIVVLTATYAP